MKRVLLWVAAWMAVQAYGQERFVVVEPDAGRMPLLSRVASIDGRRDSHYVVYANEEEQALLRQHAFRYKPCVEVPSKSLHMAATLDEMWAWEAYPTYEVYLQMMQHFADSYPALCRVDTIGTTVQGRLLLCLVLAGSGGEAAARPQFFYTSTMHGDELTGYYLLLRLADTLLRGYGHSAYYTHLLDSVQVFINPLANPDGTYYGGNGTVGRSRRYNANSVDLNRNYPDPFGTAPLSPRQPETEAMLAYAQAHRFRLAANLHGGSEVLNFPWDSFESHERKHPSHAWWQRVCVKFVDTLRHRSSLDFNDVNEEGYIAGGDWYVIPNGRQDYMNYTLGCLEMTMELSVTKRLPAEQLDTYWRALHPSLVNYIHAAVADTHFAPLPPAAVPTPLQSTFWVHPNPTTGRIVLPAEGIGETLYLYSPQGVLLRAYPAGTRELILPAAPGLYLLRRGTGISRVIKL